MAALEYLTQNSLTSHPFKARKAVYTSNGNPIADDWFYDILFVSYTPEIRSVHVSKIKKTITGDLEISFSNSETGQLLATGYDVLQEELTFLPVTISALDVVNHHQNTAQSFAAASNRYFSVKFVLGPGLVSSDPFEQVYTQNESELASGAVILYRQGVTNITFKAYDAVYTDGAFEAVLSTVKSYTHPEVPQVKFRYNSFGSLDSLKNVGMHVVRAAGAGLYANCPTPGSITQVYSINNVKPNSVGAIYLNPSSCYTSSTLSSEDVTLLGTLLDKYRPVDGFDSVIPEHSIVWENFCKPKCPPESLTAFAHYLNRVTDGAQELDTIASSSKETRGKGKSSNTDTSIFVASSFCVEGDETFSRCSDPASPGYIDCGNKFIKYFHEARTLQIFYSDPSIRKDFTIVEVIDEDTVRLDAEPTQGDNNTDLSFRVTDNGVISNMNCAIASYNIEAEAFLKPYFKVRYTTSEAYNSEGNYVTFVSVVVAIFNPSRDIVGVECVFSNSEELTQQGSYKIRTEDGVNISSTPTATLGCRKYAFIETVYFIPCETYGGALSVSVFNTTGTEDVIIGEPFSLPTINGAPCFDTVAGASETVRAIQKGSSIKFLIKNNNTGNYDEFSEFHVALKNDTTSISAFNTIPAWLNFDPICVGTERYIRLTPNISNALDANSKRFNIYYRSYGGSVSGVISQVIIDFVSLPVILAPLSQTYTDISPLVLSKKRTYTLDNPLLKIAADNMLILSLDFPFDSTTFSYSLSQVDGDTTDLPLGLLFDTASGKLYGQLDESVAITSTFKFLVDAQNPAGSSSNPQTISTFVAVEEPPVLSFDQVEQSPTFTFSNLNTFTEEEPLFTLNVENPPINGYTLIGTLPEGLTLNLLNGKITGHLTALSSANIELSLYATNFYGNSNTLTFNLDYTVYPAPEILTPTANQDFSSTVLEEWTAGSPLFTATASTTIGAPVTFSASGIPPGFFLDETSGKFYGKIADSELPEDIATAGFSRTYSIAITASSLTGASSRIVYVSLYSAGVPIINNISSGRTIAVTRNLEYTTTAPLLKISAYNSPTSFTVTGLTTLGLTYSATTGEITGTVTDSVKAGTYTVLLTATNGAGISPVVECTISVPVGLSITNISTDNIYVGVVDIFSPGLITVYSSGYKTGTSSTIITSSLPTGLSFEDDAISGTPTEAGTYTVKITASIQDFGSSSLDVIIFVSPALYKVTGTVTDSLLGNPASQVTVSAGGGKYTTTSGVDGYYELLGLIPGAYNVVASKTGYSFNPSFTAVNVLDADIPEVNFLIEGPFRKITGRLLSTTGSPIPYANISDGTYSASTGTDGRYSLYATINTLLEITPTIFNFVFNPLSRRVVSGTSDVASIDFLGSPILPPGAPTITSVSPTNEAAIIAITPPVDDGGSPVTGYEYLITGETTWNTAVVFSSPTRIYIQNLVNGEAYIVRVRARNTFGAGAQSDESSSFVPNIPAGAPLITSIASGNQQLSVIFTPPVETGGGEIVDYLYSTDSGTTFTSSGYTASPIVIETTSNTGVALVNGTAYVIRLQARTSLSGDGEPSNFLIGTPSDVPGKAAITDIFAGNNKLTIYIQAPTSDGGSPVTGYEYTINDGVDWNTAIVTTTLTSRTFIISELVNGVAVTVKVRAINIAGAGEASESASGTPCTTPEAPVITSISPGNGRLTLFVAPGGNGGAAITGYQYSVGASGVWTDVSVEIEAPLRTIVTGLNNGQLYYIRLRAVNILGPGAPSAGDKSGRPAGEPSAPIEFSLTPKDSAISASFKAAVNNGSAISSYQYTLATSAEATPDWKQLLTTATTAQSPAGYYTDIVIPETLTNFVAYYVRIRAVNAIGNGNSSEELQQTPGAGPGAVTINSASPLNSSASIQFSPPYAPPGYPIVKYQYSTAETLPISWTDFVVGSNPSSSNPSPGTSSPLKIFGLVNGTSYSVAVRAVNSISPGAASNRVVVKPATVPGAPTIASIVTASATATLTITPPTDNGGSEIINYEYTLDDGVTWLVRTPISNSTTIYIRGLNNSLSYSPKVRAYNEVGVGAASAAGVPIQTAVIPGNPIITTTTVGDAIINVNFTAPSSSGTYPISSYDYSLDDGTTWTRAVSYAPKIVITKLSHPTNKLLYGSTISNGVDYTLRIRAVSDAGEGTPSVSVIVRAGVPAAPDVSVITGYTKLKVTFSPPLTYIGAAITNYLYSIDAGATYSTAAYSLNSSPLVIENLAINTTYSVIVKLQNQYGISSPSTIIIAKTSIPPAPILKAVQNVSSPGDVKAQLTFERPVDPFDPSPVVNYEYSAKTSTSAVDVWISAAAISFDEVGAGTVLASNLTTNLYYFSLRAVNLWGTGEKSNTISSSLFSVPGQPTIVAVNPIPNTTNYRCYFTVTANGGSPITSIDYNINFKRYYKVSTVTLAQSGLEGSFVISRYDAEPIENFGSACAVFDLQIKAFNTYGASIVSATTTTPLTSPSASIFDNKTFSITLADQIPGRQDVLVVRVVSALTPITRLSLPCYEQYQTQCNSIPVAENLPDVFSSSVLRLQYSLDGVSYYDVDSISYGAGGCPGSSALIRSIFCICLGRTGYDHAVCTSDGAMYGYDIGTASCCASGHIFDFATEATFKYVQNLAFLKIYNVPVGAGTYNVRFRYSVCEFGGLYVYRTQGTSTPAPVDYTPPQAPSSPVIGTLSQGPRPNSVQFSFTPGAGGGAVDAYEYKYYYPRLDELPIPETPETAEARAAVTMLSGDITTNQGIKTYTTLSGVDLRLGTYVNVQIRARNAGGYSSWSNILQKYVGVIAAPVITTTTKIDEHNLEIEFTQSLYGYPGIGEGTNEYGTTVSCYLDITKIAFSKDNGSSFTYIDLYSDWKPISIDTGQYCATCCSYITPAVNGDFTVIDYPNSSNSGTGKVQVYSESAGLLQVVLKVATSWGESGISNAATSEFFAAAKPLTPVLLSGYYHTDLHGNYPDTSVQYSNGYPQALGDYISLGQLGNGYALNQYIKLYIAPSTSTVAENIKKYYYSIDGGSTFSEILPAAEAFDIFQDYRGNTFDQISVPSYTYFTVNQSDNSVYIQIANDSLLVPSTPFTYVNNKNGAFSTGYYIDNTIDISYSNSTPQLAQDNGELYTYIDGESTFVPSTINPLIENTSRKFTHGTFIDIIIKAENILGDSTNSSPYNIAIDIPPYYTANTDQGTFGSSTYLRYLYYYNMAYVNVYIDAFKPEALKSVDALEYTHSIVKSAYPIRKSSSVSTLVITLNPDNPWRKFPITSAEISTSFNSLWFPCDLPDNNNQIYFDVPALDYSTLHKIYDLRIRLGTALGKTQPLSVKEIAPGYTWNYDTDLIDQLIQADRYPVSPIYGGSAQLLMALEAPIIIPIAYTNDNSKHQITFKIISLQPSGHILPPEYKTTTRYSLDLGRGSKYAIFKSPSECPCQSWTVSDYGWVGIGGAPAEGNEDRQTHPENSCCEGYLPQNYLIPVQHYTYSVDDGDVFDLGEQKLDYSDVNNPPRTITLDGARTHQKAVNEITLEYVNTSSHSISVTAHNYVSSASSTIAFTPNLAYNAGVVYTTPVIKEVAMSIGGRVIIRSSLENRPLPQDANNQYWLNSSTLTYHYSDGDNWIQRTPMSSTKLGLIRGSNTPNFKLMYLFKGHGYNLDESVYSAGSSEWLDASTFPGIAPSITGTIRIFVANYYPSVPYVFHTGDKINLNGDPNIEYFVIADITPELISTNPAYYWAVPAYFDLEVQAVTVDIAHAIDKDTTLAQHPDYPIESFIGAAALTDFKLYIEFPTLQGLVSLADYQNLDDKHIVAPWQGDYYSNDPQLVGTRTGEDNALFIQRASYNYFLAIKAVDDQDRESPAVYRHFSTYYNYIDQL